MKYVAFKGLVQQYSATTKTTLIALVHRVYNEFISPHCTREAICYSVCPISGPGTREIFASGVYYFSALCTQWCGLCKVK